MPFVNLIDLEATKIGTRLKAKAILEAKSAAEDWIDFHRENFDCDTEDALSHYLESTFEVSRDICDGLANNTLIDAGLKD